jgi:hypothetical protein
MRRPMLAIIALLVAACGGQSGTASAPSDAAYASQLRAAPASLGCDAMPVPYRRVTFQIDPGTADPVTAITDLGASLATYWSPGFTLTSVQFAAAAPVVQDANGQVVATSGETLDIPEGAWPRLHGYFVCPSPDALYVLLDDPT